MTTTVAAPNWHETPKGGARQARTGGRTSLDPVAKTGKKVMYEELMEEAVSEVHVGRALKAVQRNRGAAGIDHMKTTELEGHLQRHWPKIRAKLLAGTYAVTPVRRAEISKPDGGVRRLGIPTVQDRFIQQLLLQVMTPIFEPKFLRAQLRIPAGTQRARCRESGTRVRRVRERLGGGSGYREVFRSSQP